MYGQTEATARMAYLPPELAATVPGAIGVAVPGGAFRIEPVPGLEHGELVYYRPQRHAWLRRDRRGPRKGPEHRASSAPAISPGSTPQESTKWWGAAAGSSKSSDCALTSGRWSGYWPTSACRQPAPGRDDGLVVAVEGDHDTRLLGKVLAQGMGVPRAALELHTVQQLPRLATGKLDYQAVLALSRPDREPADADKGRGRRRPRAASGRIFRDALEVADIADGDTFVSLGGDSLSYVAASVRLEQALGHLPPDWHVTPVRDLEPRAQRLRRSGSGGGSLRRSKRASCCGPWGSS